MIDEDLEVDTKKSSLVGVDECVSVYSNGHGMSREADIMLGKFIMECLVNYYPLHNWGVEVNHEAGYAAIRLIYKDFEGEKRISNYGYVILIPNIQGKSDLQKKVMRAGGEWLERYGITRGKATPYAVMDAKEHKLDLVV